LVTANRFTAKLRSQPRHRLGGEPTTARSLERSVLRHLWVIDEEMGKVARQNR
jgi:hypothetical protein